jgi:hypothetical protein
MELLSEDIGFYRSGCLFPPPWKIVHEDYKENGFYPPLIYGFDSRKNEFPLHETLLLVEYGTGDVIAEADYILKDKFSTRFESNVHELIESAILAMADCIKAKQKFKKRCIKVVDESIKKDIQL